MQRTLRVTITRGLRAGTTFEIAAGVPAVVGRARDAAIAIEDPGLSRRHCEVLWDGQVARVRDLGSRNGVLLNGRQVNEGVLANGDLLEAGDCTIRVGIEAIRRRLEPVGAETSRAHVDRAEPTPAAPDPPTRPLAILSDLVSPLEAPDAEEPAGESESDLVRALDTLTAREPGVQLFALVDGAQAFDLVCEARLQSHAAYTLFSGDMALAMAHVGPCLIALDRPHRFCRRWAGRIGQHVGVLLSSRAELDAVYAHLRQLFVVADEEGQEYFFRFYDPRVLRTFLPTCTPAELLEFFGPVDAWVVESAEADEFRQFSLGNGRLGEDTLAPATAAPPEGIDVGTRTGAGSSP